MELTHEAHDKIDELSIKITDLKNKMRKCSSNKEIEEITLTIKKLKWQKKKILAGIDPDLIIKTKEFLLWVSEKIDAKVHSIDDFDREIDVDYDYIHFCESGIIWQLHKSISFQILTRYVDAGDYPFLDNQQKVILISCNEKQLFNIPTNQRPIETYENDINKLCTIILAFMQDTYKINDMNTSDIVLSKCKQYSLIMIPKHHVDNTDEKTIILHKLRNYIGLNCVRKDAILLDSRIRFPMTYGSYPHIEELGVITKTTVDDKTFDFFKKEPSYASFSEIGDSKHITNNITLNAIDNSVKNVDNSINVNQSQNVNIVRDSTNSSAVSVTNTSVKIHKIDKHQDYINFVSNTPPAWHKKNNVINVADLYEIYKKEIKGNTNIQQFGKFISSLDKVYVKFNDNKSSTNRHKYKIL